MKNLKRKKKKENAFNVGDTDSFPGWGTKIPYAAEQLSP